MTNLNQTCATARSLLGIVPVTSATLVLQLNWLPEPDRSEWTNDDWATPWEIVRSLEAEFGQFDLDPCCTEATAKAQNFYTKAEDGLQQPWTGRVFCNPPYSQKGLWLRKAYESSLQGAFVVCLVPARTDAAWFHEWILGKAEIRFQRRRVIFRGVDGMEHKTKRPIDGTIFAIYRPRLTETATEFNEV